jgi:hypothetical protein
MPGVRRFHHRQRITHAGFEVGHPSIAVGKTGAAFVEQNKPRETRQLFAKLGVLQVFPGQIEMRDQPRHNDQVERLIAAGLVDHLIGDADIAVSGITGFGTLHRRS